ncbi:amino acid permease, partial [Lactobacillus delbrueckii subsp. lactis]
GDIGISAAAGVINFVVLTAAASACNSSLFSTGRMLFSLNYGKKGKFARKMSSLSRTQVPANGLIFSAAVIALAVIAEFIVPNASVVFTFISSVATVCFLFIWGAIVLAHLRYRKSLQKQGLENPVNFKLPLFPVANYLILLFLAFVGVIMCFDQTTFYALLAALIWFGGLYMVLRLQRTK